MDGLFSNRRQLLRNMTIVTLLPMVGCLDNNSDQSNTDEEPNVGGLNNDSNQSNTDKRPRSDDGKTDSEHLALYKQHLETNEITVHNLSFEESERIVSVEYQSQKTDEEELASEIGTISGGVMKRLRDGWEVQRLEALIIQGGESIATWHMKREWFEQFENDSRSADELSTEILSTLEFVN